MTLAVIMMTPARRTPSMTATTVDLKSMSRILAARVPVHAPVPGRGIPTNNKSATKSPLPAFSVSFLPPFSPFSRQNVKNLPIYFSHTFYSFINLYFFKNSIKCAVSVAPSTLSSIFPSPTINNIGVPNPSSNNLSDLTKLAISSSLKSSVFK